MNTTSRVTRWEDIFGESVSRKRPLILLFVLTLSFPLFAGDIPPLNLGSGQPGLHIIYKSKDQYVIYLDEPWTVGDALIGGYDQRKIDVLVDRNYGLREQIRTRMWGDGPQQLYPFDDETAYTREGDSKPPDDQVYTTNRVMGYFISADGKSIYFPRKTQVFSTNVGNILISDDVYALARLRYGLTTNQLFLGRIGTNIFFWETRDVQTVYYHAAQDAQTTNYFRLPKGVEDIYGVTKAINTNEDVGIYVLRKSRGWFSYAPNEFALSEVSFKNSKQTNGSQ